MRIGYVLSSEEHRPQELVRQARMAEQAGFEGLWISDHYHPWNEEQGQSPFVWSVIGALSQASRLPVTTAVTCPTVRIHPAVVAQAAATSAVLLDGRFALGVGTGEALNEHIYGDPWPPFRERLAMLAEAVDLLRALWTGRTVTHRGAHYTVINARIHTLPEQPPPIYVSAFGPKAAEVAGRVGDGLISTIADASLVRAFRAGGGDRKVTQGGYKVAVDRDVAAARRTAQRLWPNVALPGQLAQVLPLPSHFEQATELVTEDLVAGQILCGDDADAHVALAQRYVEAGYDELFVSQIGPTSEPFFEFYAERVLPRLRG